MNILGRFLESIGSMFASHNPVIIGIGCLMVVCTVAILAIVIWSIAYLVDTVGISTRTGEGSVEWKKFHKAYSSTSLTTVGKVLVPIVRHYPARHEVSVWVTSLERSGTIDVDPDLYARLRQGSPVRLEYGFGRLTRTLRIASLQG